MPKPTRSPITTTAVPCDIRAADGDGVRRFQLEAYTGEPMRIWPYDSPVVIDLDSVDLSVQRVPALYDHVPDADYIVGQVESVRVADGKIVASGMFTLTDAPAERNYCRKVLDRADAGYQWQVSVGGNPKKIEDIPAGQSIDVNGRSYAGPVSVARGLSLREISFVVLGGDRLTSAVVSRSKPNSIQGAAAMSFEDWLTSMGFDSEAQSTMTEVQVANMKKLYADEYGEGEEATPSDETAPSDTVTNAESSDVPGDKKEEDDTMTNAGAKKSTLNATAELKRSKAILAATKRWGNPTITVNGQSVTVAAHAIAQGWTPDQAELQAMRSKLVTPPAPIIKANGSATLQTLTAAMMLKCGVRLDNPAFSRVAGTRLLDGAPWLRASLNDSARNQIMDSAHRYADMSAVDMAREVLRATGGNYSHGRSEMIQAAFSTASFANVITTSMNAILIQKYLEAPDTTVGWVTEQDVNNYLLNERSRVTTTKGLSPQPENAEADSFAPADTKETYKVERFSGKLVIDEIAIINDTLGAFAEEATAMGLAAARLRPDLVYATLLANPTLAGTGRALFNSTDGNLLTSAALASGTLSAARKAMAVIQENGVSLGIVPTHLIVPMALGDTAYNLVSSQLQLIAASTGSDRTTGENNALKRHNFSLVEEPRLDNGVVHPATKVSYAGSATSWYMASSQAPSLEIGYLAGAGRAPKTDTGRLTEGKYGVWWSVQHTIGICPRDWRGLNKSNA